MSRRYGRRSRSRSWERDRRGGRRERSRSRSPRRDRHEGSDDEEPVPQTVAGESFREFQELLSRHNQERERHKPVDRLQKKGVNPISVDELRTIAKRAQQEEKGALKPVFLTKKQREAEALKRLQSRRNSEKNHEKMLLEQRRKFERTIEERRGRKDNNRYNRHNRVDNEEEERRRLEREKSKGEREYEKQLQLIKDQYLGKKTNKKRFVPPSQKFKFSFDWEVSDDTSGEVDPLYSNRHKTALLYGRGFVGGMDRVIQRKQASSRFYDELINNREALTTQLDTIRDQEKSKARRERERVKEREREKLARNWRDKRLDDMEERDWRIFKEEFSIYTRGNAPYPIRFWKEVNIPDELQNTITDRKLGEPTPIQRAAIPCGLHDQDVVAISETGSGKTAAYLLPMIVYICRHPRMDAKMAVNGPYAIVLAPTREMAQEISNEAKAFMQSFEIRSGLIITGVNIEEQGAQLKEGVELLIATPDRLFNCLHRKFLVLRQCHYVVLDEVDRMINMDFEPQIVRILDEIPSSNLRPIDQSQEVAMQQYRQTMIFSASMPLKVELLAKKYLRRPVFIAIGDRRGRAASNVDQRVEWIVDAKKKTRLLEIIKDETPPIIVFCNSTKQCDLLCRWLGSEGWSSTVIHKEQPQEQKERNLAAFKKCTYDIMVADDIEFDIRGVNHVINFELPNDIERYTSRIGFSGQAGMRGTATAFLTETDTEIMFDLREMLQTTGNLVPLELAQNEHSKINPVIEVQDLRNQEEAIYVN